MSVGVELFFAIAAPIGGGGGLLCEILDSVLHQHGFSTETVDVIETLPKEERPPNFHSDDVSLRYDCRIRAGNDFREFAFEELTTHLGSDDDAKTAGNAALAYLVVERVLAGRGVDSEEIKDRHAYIFRSLKRPEEARKLREVYGPAFFLVAAYAPDECRVTRLSRKIAARRGLPETNLECRHEAERLVERDKSESQEVHGQRLAETFSEADVLVDIQCRETAESAIRRFINLIFGAPFLTPTRDEYGMFVAFGSAVRSADLSRQVGAAILTPDGQVIATGTNDVPKAGGGLYWEGDQEDARDPFFPEADAALDLSSVIKKRGLLELTVAVLAELQEQGELELSDALKDAEGNVGTDRLKELYAGLYRKVKGTELMSVIEFGRTVHAEMAALMDAARSTASVDGATLYTTTFPCHLCARHIICSGVRSVRFIEPYPKSHALEMYSDSITVDGGRRQGRVEFRTYVGVTPRRYLEFFTMSDRRRLSVDRTITKWVPSEAEPRFYHAPAAYVELETAFTEIAELLTESWRQRAPKNGENS